MEEEPLRTAAELRQAYRQVLDSVLGLVTPLNDAGFESATGCPGWTVHDTVAHISAVESILIGRPLPDHRAPEGLPHVRSSFGAFIENGVDYRRGWSRRQVLDEYREVTAERLKSLDGVRDHDLEAEAQGLFGTAKLRNVLAIRIFDIWTHEQDIRRAVGVPGGLDGLLGRHARDRPARGIGNRLAERGVAPEGTSLLLDFTHPVAAQHGVVFAAGQGRAGSVPERPTVTLRGDLASFTVLGCGRADDPGAASRIGIDGDAELGQLFVADLAFTP